MEKREFGLIVMKSAARTIEIIHLVRSQNFQKTDIFTPWYSHVPVRKKC